MAAGAQHCPCCGAQVEPSPRYPDYLCAACAARATTREGRALAFSNEGFSGGFVAHYADDGTRHDSHLCYVDGRQCWADEAHMGGIVIRPSPDGRHPIGGKAAI